MSGIMDVGRVPAKPILGDPCNGCGYCCAMEACALAREYISADIPGPCPALEFEGGRLRCGLVRRPSLYMRLPNEWADALLGSLFAQMLGVGKGCDAEDPGRA